MIIELKVYILSQMWYNNSTWNLVTEKWLFPRIVYNFPKLLDKVCIYQPTLYATIPTPVIYIGESGLVYRGYIEIGGGKDVVAIKTCKGKK